MYGAGGAPNSTGNVPSAFGSGNNISERQMYGGGGFPGPYGVCIYIYVPLYVNV
jgi:hypothetical protein